MTRYTVTTELKTPWYLTVLRWFKLKEPRMEFDLQFTSSLWEVGDNLYFRPKMRVKVIKKFKTL